MKKILERIKGLLLSIPPRQAAAFYRRRCHRLFLRHRDRCDGGILCAVLCHSGLYQGGCRRVEEAGGLVVCRLAGDHTGRAGDSNRGLDCLENTGNKYQVCLRHTDQLPYRGGLS